MTKLTTAHRMMSILTLLALLSTGAFGQSDSAPRPAAPDTPAADKTAGDKRVGEKPPEGSQGAHSDSAYVIGANDVLAVNVWKEPDISRSVPVRSDGKISLPLV
jgi:protein involved in polysaccharide export with SLBB domain